MNRPWVYICPFSLEPSSHFPPHPTPLGCHRTLALGSLHHTANSRCLLILHMVMHMFQRYSLKSSHLLLPPLCPQVLYVCHTDILSQANPSCIPSSVSAVYAHRRCSKKVRKKKKVSISVSHVCDNR